MAEDFRGPRLKFQRAQHHIADLNDLLRRFMQVQTFKAIPDFDIRPGAIVWVARGQKRFDHREFSPIIGDTLHNLRDSLDLAISVLMRNAGESDVGVYFPTGESRNHFEKAIGKGPKTSRSAKIPKFPARVISVLKRIEPYGGGHGHWLRTLHDLAIADKHRLIVPTVFGLDTVHIWFDTKGELPMRFWQGPVPIEDGKQLAVLGADEWPEIERDQEARVTLSVEFDRSAGQLWRWPIVEGAIRLMNVTESALDALGTCL